MSNIIKSLDKRTGITYVYKSISYWDREKKQPRAKRTLIGKIDPETGDMVPTDGRGSGRKKQISSHKNIIKSINELVPVSFKENIYYSDVYAKKKNPTARKIAIAFLNVCKKKSIRNITIQNIICECAIARQTFYNHFLDKQDLMNYVYQMEAEYSFECFSCEKLDIKSSTYWMLCRCIEKRDFYIDVASYDIQNGFADFFYLSEMDFYKTYIIEQSGKEYLTGDLESAIEFNCAGAKHLFVNWIKKGMVEKPERLANMIIEFMPDLLKEKVLK